MTNHGAFRVRVAEKLSGKNNPPQTFKGTWTLHRTSNQRGEKKRISTNESLSWRWKRVAVNQWWVCGVVLCAVLIKLARSSPSLPDPDWRTVLGGCQGCVEGMDKLPVRDELWKRGAAVYLSVSVSMRQPQYCLPYWICYALRLGPCFSQP